MPRYYDSAETGPPAIDGSVAYCEIVQPREKVARPNDRRAKSLQVRERVEQARCEKEAGGVDAAQEPPQEASPKSESSHNTQRSLTKEEKVQLIHESADHPYLRRILEGLDVVKPDSVRHTLSSKLRAGQHSKQGLQKQTLHGDSKVAGDDPNAIAMGTPPSPTAIAAQPGFLSETSPPVWVLSKHSAMNTSAKKKKHAAKRSPRRKAEAKKGSAKVGANPLHTKGAMFSDVSKQLDMNGGAEYPALKTLMDAKDDKEGGQETQGALSRLTAVDATEPKVKANSTSPERETFTHRHSRTAHGGRGGEKVTKSTSISPTPAKKPPVPVQKKGRKIQRSVSEGTKAKK